jgi:hypothetical protein
LHCLPSPDPLIKTVGIEPPRRRSTRMSRKPERSCPGYYRTGQLLCYRTIEASINRYVIDRSLALLNQRPAWTCDSTVIRSSRYASSERTGDNDRKKVRWALESRPGLLRIDQDYELWLAMYSRSQSRIFDSPNHISATPPAQTSLHIPNDAIPSCLSASTLVSMSPFHDRRITGH